MEPMRQKRIPATLTSIALLTSLGLTACTTNTDPTPPPPSTATTPDTTPKPQPEPTQTPTADPTTPSGPPEKPAAMANNNEEGALAAAEYFLDTIEYALLSGEKAPVEEFSDTQCTFCKSTLKMIDEDRKIGRKLQIFKLEFKKQPVAAKKDVLWVIEEKLTYQTKHRLKDGVVKTEEGIGNSRFLILFDAGNWRLITLDVTHLESN